MLAALRIALAGLLARRGRTALTAAGILAAAIVVGTTLTVGLGLATGFDRAADAADLPDVLIRFDETDRAPLTARVAALPNLAEYGLRREITRVPLSDGRGHRSGQGVLQLLLGGEQGADPSSPGRRGYTVVAGRDLTATDREAVLVERGLADSWDLAPGDTLRVGRRGRVRIVGVTVSPDNVAFPLARTARVYASPADLGIPAGRLNPNIALLWLVDPARADVTLTQARAVSYGVGGLRFVTRDGIEVLLDGAAGIVIALLVAFSAVALLAAGAMLSASANAEVARRLPAIGVQRALGFSPGQVAAVAATEAILVALPAGAVGLAIGTWAVAGPSAALLATLNELPPGSALAGPLALALAAMAVLVTASATLPAWRAARRPPAEILRGGDLSVGRGGRSGAGRLAGGPFALGARFALARRGRWLAASVTVGVCAGVVLLMLALASLLVSLRNDPATLGRRYQLAAALPASAVGAVRALPGVDTASSRVQTDATDAYRLGESLRVVGYPGDHTVFEDPPLAEGRRLTADDEAEVGLGLAQALGLRPGSRIALQLASGRELRLRVVGVVRALENDGRIAYTRAGPLLDADPASASTVVVRLASPDDRDRVTAGLTRLGAAPQAAAAAATSSAAFLGVLAGVLRGVGLAVALVCLYALAQALAVTARERRGAVALLRATGAGTGSVIAVLLGAAMAVAVPAGVIGVVLERFAFGPLVERLAADYADLGLAPTPFAVAGTVVGLLGLAALAAALVGRRLAREPIVDGLREER